MTNFASLQVIAASCVFPSGPGLALASCALRSSSALNSRHRIYLDKTGQKAKVSQFPLPTTYTVDRWVELAKAGLTDLFAQLSQPIPAALQNQTCTIYLVLPHATRLGVPAGLAEAILRAVPKLPLKCQTSNVIYGGHAAGAQVIQQLAATGSLQSPAIILALDSWLHPNSMYWLEMQGLLHNSGQRTQGHIRSNPYGRIPSEGASAIMLASGTSVPSWCRITGIGAAEESVLFHHTKPCTGQGLTQAAQQALQTLPKENKVTHIFSDLNGEPYRADQFGFTALRISDRLADNWGRYTPPLVSGDIGTATALAHIALSANILRQQKSYEPIDTHLLLSSSDDSLRGAVVLSR